MEERVPERVARLAKIASALGRPAAHRKLAGSWPDLWLFTDPDRTLDVLTAAALMKRGSGIVLRTFGRADVEAVAQPLALLARRHGLVLLIGADEALAAQVGADGLHLPERMRDRLPRLRARHPKWRFTVAAHDAAALAAATRAGADAAFLSPVLPSLSPSAGRPLGPTRTAALVRAASLPVYGLGGIDAETVVRLRNTGLRGVAGVSFADAPRT